MARHHFSSGGYFDPYLYRDLEIITYVRQGAIIHRDSLGNEGWTETEDVRVMHAGWGITHLNTSVSRVRPAFFQIWLIPDQAGVEPGWGARSFPAAGEEMRVLAAGDGRDGALPLHADGVVLVGKLAAGHALAPEQ